MSASGSFTGRWGHSAALDVSNKLIYISGGNSPLQSFTDIWTLSFSSQCTLISTYINTSKYKHVHILIQCAFKFYLHF